MKLKICAVGLIVSVLLAKTGWAHHGTAAFGGGTGGPINGIPASLLAAGQSSAALRFDYLKFDRFSDAELLQFSAAGIDTHSIDASYSAFFNYAYGVTDYFTAAVQVPYLYLDNIRAPGHHGSPHLHDEGDSAGIGDLLALGFFRLVSLEDDSYDLIFIAGLEMPTGRTDDLTSGGDPFEPDHQPGSGSWDPVLGAAMSRTWERWSFNIDSLYTFTGRGTADSILGDICTYNAAVVYRLGGHSHSHDHSHDHPHDHASRYVSPVLGSEAARFVRQVAYHPEDDHNGHDRSHNAHSDCDCHCHGHGLAIDLILELNGIWEGEDLIDGELNPNSGGNVIYASPGIRFIFGESWALFLSGGVPIAQRPNGFNHAADYRLTAGVGFLY